MQTSKLATWKKSYRSNWNASETHREMSSLLVVVKCHLFLAVVQFLHLSRERDKVAAVTTSARTGESGKVAAINRGERAWHSGEKRGGGSYSQP